MNIQIAGELEFKILDRKGHLERMLKKPMYSFLRNFIRHPWYFWQNTGLVLIDVTGTSRSMAVSTILTANAPAANDNYGILVGTGTNSVSCLDNNLQTKIAHGNGAGQLYHQATTLTLYTESAAQAYFPLSRNFNNNSGGTITVNEVGLALFASAYTYYFLFSRDLTGGIDVLNGKTLVAQYTLKVTA